MSDSLCLRPRRRGGILRGSVNGRRKAWPGSFRRHAALETRTVPRNNGFAVARMRFGWRRRSRLRPTQPRARLLLIDEFLKFLAGAEEGQAFRNHRDAFPGFKVAPGVATVFLDFEAAEPADFCPFPGDQRFFMASMNVFTTSDASSKGILVSSAKALISSLLFITPPLTRYTIIPWGKGDNAGTQPSFIIPMQHMQWVNRLLRAIHV